MCERRQDQSFLHWVAKLTGAMSHCKQVLVQWVPAQGGDSHLACSVKLEPPERKKRALVLSVLICTILIILEVCEVREGGRRGEEGREEEGRREERREKGVKGEGVKRGVGKM